jgi:hypothetical protein
MVAHNLMHLPHRILVELAKRVQQVLIPVLSIDSTLDATVLNAIFDQILPSSLHIDVAREIEAELNTPPVQIWIGGQAFQIVEDAIKKGSPKAGGPRDRLKTVTMMLAPFLPLYSSAVFERAQTSASLAVGFTSVSQEIRGKRCPSKFPAKRGGAMSLLSATS